MNKSAIIYVILLAGKFCFCQDTIFTKAQGQLYVRVLEISNTEVTYKNYFNPDGVIHSIVSSQVIKITYENGKEESKFQLAQKTNSSASNALKKSQFVIEGKHLSLNNEDITHKAALKLMMKRDSQSNSDDLNEALLNAEDKKNKQIAFTILAPVCVVGGFYMARRNYYGPQDKGTAQIFILSGLTLGATSFVLSRVYKSIKNNYIRKAAALYNAEL